MGLFGRWRRGAAAKTHIDDALWQNVLNGLPFLRGLSAHESARLRELALAFLEQKQMHGAQGLELTNAMRLSIAVQACLPVLNLGLDLYSGWIGIVVYPGEFVVHREQMDEDGIVHNVVEPLSGEAWPGGPVILSWEDAGMTDSGYNVVIHEFAHKIHMRLGNEESFPPASKDMDANQWKREWESAYQRLCLEVDAGRPTLVDPYACEHPAEFFAVMSEEFFTGSALLARDYPGLYRQLVLFYRQDPAGIGDR